MSDKKKSVDIKKFIKTVSQIIIKNGEEKRVKIDEKHYEGVSWQNYMFIPRTEVGPVIYNGSEFITMKGDVYDPHLRTFLPWEYPVEKLLEDFREIFASLNKGVKPPSPTVVETGVTQNSIGDTSISVNAERMRYDSPVFSYPVWFTGLNFVMVFVMIPLILFYGFIKRNPIGYGLGVMYGILDIIIDLYKYSKQIPPVKTKRMLIFTLLLDVMIFSFFMFLFVESMIASAIL